MRRGAGRPVPHRRVSVRGPAPRKRAPDARGARAGPSLPLVAPRDSGDAAPGTRGAGAGRVRAGRGVGVKYLRRAARRLATVGASDGVASVRPAIPSRSPLAEADQRLNLDSFAERFNAPLVPESTAPMIKDE